MSETCDDKEETLAACRLAFDALRQLSNSAEDPWFFKPGAPGGEASTALRKVLKGMVADDI
jgi:hypothetical protein